MTIPESIIAYLQEHPSGADVDQLAAALGLSARYRALDEAFLATYGWNDPLISTWQAIDLGHAFHAVDTLPENDRIRYTISPSARKELLRRLLALNHERAAVEAVMAAKKPQQKKRGKRNEQASEPQLELFE